MMAAIGTDQKAWHGLSVDAALQTGDVFVGLHFSALFGDNVRGLTGLQVVPILRFRGGLDIGSQKPDLDKLLDGKKG